MSKLQIHSMQASDLDRVLLIQAACYTGDIPESRVSLAAKLFTSPSSCFVAKQFDGEVLAYLIALPWIVTEPPALNALSCELPVRPDCLYLHDLAVHPSVRTGGVGASLIERFLQRSSELDFSKTCLVAIQNSVGYWRRFGFHPCTSTSALAAKLATYGSDAQFLLRNVDHSSSR